MAKIVTDAVVIEISRIARDEQDLAPVADAEMITTLEQVVQQLVGDGVIVEVKTAG